MNKLTSLSESAAPFSRLSEPSDTGYFIAADVEHVLMQRGFTNLPLCEMARVIDTDLNAFNKRYVAMENALSYMSQIAMMHGAGEEEMRRVGKLIEEGDKP